MQYEAVVVDNPGHRGMIRVHRSGSLHYELVPLSCVRKP